MADGKKEVGKVDKAVVELYKIKGIVSTNAIELELPSSIKIYPIINVS